jgi:hypothetical protein
MYMPQPNKVITRNPAHDYGESVQAEPQVQPQAEKQAEPTQVKPEDRPQDELARTAQALVDQLGQEQSTNEKLQNSQFMQLLRGLGEGSVVVQEGTGAREAGQEVGDGAKFVASNGGNWASSFLGGAPAAAATATAMAQPQSTLGTEQDPYLDQFQAALTMNDGRNRVHFDPAAPMQGSMMPRDLNEAVQHRTAMPSSSATWEESLEDDEYDDYDTEALRNFNGGHIAEPEVGVSNASREDWDALQAWDDEMRTGTEEPYLFHSANPYALGSPIMRELSPTTMVSLLALFMILQLTAPGRARARGSSPAGAARRVRMDRAGPQAAGERARGRGDPRSRKGDRARPRRARRLSRSGSQLHERGA